jgi:hypothetical protein
MTTRSYSELRHLETFGERFDYLKLGGRVGRETFGYDRWINQQFYTSVQWRQLRHFVISRDMGCDLGVDGYDIFSGLVIHHMNPITVEDLEHGNADVLDPEFLITTSHRTHNAIHYGDAKLLPRDFTERKPGDTTLW